MSGTKGVHSIVELQVNREFEEVVYLRQIYVVNRPKVSTARSRVVR